MGKQQTMFVPTDATVQAVKHVCGVLMMQTSVQSFAPNFDAASNPAPRHNNI